MDLERVVISAPWGNYVKARGCTRTYGTFTAARRGGVTNRAWRVLKTVRYYPRLDAWVNKIGLRNPGIDWLVEKVKRPNVAAEVAASVVSIHGFSASDWYTLLDKVALAGPAAVELNMSCPNVGELSWPEDLFKRARALEPAGEGGAAKRRVIVKLPPVRYEAMVTAALEAGLACFHACNTLPVRGGGMSGRPLQPLSLACVRWLRQETQGHGSVDLIGGGGVREPDDVDRFAQAGADRVALGTKLMHPRYLRSDVRLQPIVERAASLWGQAS